MPTLWEILAGKLKKKTPLELQFCNPLELRLGNSVKVDNIDLGDVAFTLNSFREVKQVIGGVEFFFVDYEIASSLYGRDEKMVRRIRLNPKEQGDSKKITDYDVILYEKISECEYDEAFHKSLEGQEEFVEQDATYWRVNDNTKQQDASIHMIDSQAILDYAKSQTLPIDESLTYWDFWRDVNDEADIKALEFYNIEMNSQGYFEFWVGRKVDPNRISIV
jgi:hypothetical protein